MSTFQIGDPCIIQTPIGAYRARIENFDSGAKGGRYEVLFYDLYDVKIIYVSPKQIWTLNDPTAPNPGPG